MKDQIEDVKKVLADYLETENLLKLRFIVMSNQCPDKIQGRKWGDFHTCGKVKGMPVYCNFNNCPYLKG